MFVLNELTWTSFSRRVLISKYLFNSFQVSEMNSLAVKDPTQFLPPLEVRGMKSLDKDKFNKSIIVPWLEIEEHRVGSVMGILKKYLMKVVNIKPLRPAFELLEGEEIVSFPVSSVLRGTPKRVFLNPILLGDVDDFADEDKQKLEALGVNVKLQFSKINIGYGNFRADDILKAVLPEENPLTSYSLIGHIVHVNLRENQLPFKEIIGKVLLDKVIGAKTVVNKTDIIDSTYRNFKMELLAGIENMVTRTREHGCLYELDFSTVYWNPRLCTEHERIASKLESGDILYDVFAGIGPFSIPAGKKKCHVLANDLNPESFKWLNVNCRLNKVQQFVKTFNKDGRTFITENIKKDMLEKFKSNEFGKSSIHITMNLPASAVTFLSAFHGLLCDCDELRWKTSPIVHVYCFVGGENPKVSAQAVVEENLGSKLDTNLIEVCFVRNVAPNKEMMRVSFKLSHAILTVCNNYSEKHTAPEETEEAPSPKRVCLSSETKSSC